GDVLVKFAARLDNQFGGGGRRGSADIGNKIGDSEIGFVADAGDDRDFGSEDGARDDFFVEGPQIFHGAAAAREDEHVDEFPSIEKLQGLNDFFGRAFALHAHRKKYEMDIGEAPREDARNVTDSSALW